MGHLTELVKLPNGYLRIQLTLDGKIERDLMQNGVYYFGEYERLLDYWIEEHIGNGWDMVRPEEIGALTGDENTILTDTAERDDYGELVACQTVWYDNFYAVRDPVTELLDEGYVDFWPSEVESAA